MYDEQVKQLRELQAITEHCDEQSCDECENRELCYKHDNKTLSRTYKEAADAIEELMRRCEQFQYMPPPAWIPVEERLPEEYVNVLCYYEYYRYGEYNCMFRTIDRGYYGDGIWGGEAGQGHKNKVLAWMPLPQPPKEE